MYTNDQLSELTGVPERTISHYVERGLLPPCTGAYWTEHHYRLLVAINRLHRDGVSRIAAIKTRLDAMTPEALAAFVGADGAGDEEHEEDEEDRHPDTDDGRKAPAVTAAAKVEAAPPLPAPPLASPPVPSPPAATPLVSAPLPAPAWQQPAPAARLAPSVGTTWVRHTLGPGLELHVSAQADPRTLERAEEILDRFRQGS